VLLTEEKSVRKEETIMAGKQKKVKKITKINPVKPQVMMQLQPTKRVCAYCRVSTDSREQQNSFIAQTAYYEELISKRSDWQYVGVYADEARSGTKLQKRDDFLRMIKDCEAGKIDMIITKSVTRFARNTVDSIKAIRKLKLLGIAVFFEKENINTLDSKGEILLTIMASLAQQESQSLSQNVKLGIQYRYQQGKIHINHNRFLGYTKDKDGNLVIVPEEAEIVKRIYREYLEGSSMLQIARGLEADGILTGAGNPRWHTSTINKILRNEKYIGDALLQKTYTVDFLSKKRVPNNGIVPQYYVENSHEPIIPREIFMQVQEQLVKRRCVHISKNGKKRNYSNNHPLSQMVFCGNCHEIFRRVHWNNRGKKSIVWRCVSRLENTCLFCTASTILEDTLKEKIVEAINVAVSGKNSFLAILKKNIETVLSEDLDESTADIDKRLEELQTDLIQKANSKEAYDNIVNEIYRLRDLRQETLSRNALRQDKRDRIAEMTDFLNMQTGDITEFDDKLVRKLVEKAIVYDDRIVVEFKSGLEIEVNL
jgi:site-specific DNA recombinase